MFNRPIRLPPRKREILSMAAEGLVNKEIAALCGLSLRTVENTLASIYTELGLDTEWGSPRVRAIRWWLERGRAQAAGETPSALVTIAVNGQVAATVTIAVEPKE